MFDLQRLAKYEPDRLASEFFDATEIRLLRVLLHRVKSSYDIRPPSKQSIAEFTVGLGHNCRIHPTEKSTNTGYENLMDNNEKVNGSRQHIHSTANDWNDQR